MIVRSRRGALLLQAALLFTGAVLAGWAVEAWNLLPMARLSGRAGMPVALSLFAVVGLLLAVTVVKDHWGHRIVFEGDQLHVRDSLGAARIRYDEIVEVRSIPFFGVGLRLKPGSRWLATFEGSPAARAKKERMTAITRGPMAARSASRASYWTSASIASSRSCGRGCRRRLVKALPDIATQWTR